jgi:hypothetical protein
MTREAMGPSRGPANRLHRLRAQLVCASTAAPASARAATADAGSLPNHPRPAAPPVPAGLTAAQWAGYCERGYLVVRDAVAPRTLADMQASQ